MKRLINLLALASLVTSPPVAAAGVGDYSTTPSANTSINGIYIGEGMAAGDVNDAIRQMMADIATFSAGGGGGGGCADCVTLNGTQTLNNKTLNAPVLSTVPTSAAGSIGYLNGRLQFRDSSATRNVLHESTGGVYWSGSDHLVDPASPNQANAVGYRGSPRVLVPSSRALLLPDQGRTLAVQNAGQTITIPTNATLALPVGFTTYTTTLGNFTVAVAPSGGVSLYESGSTASGTSAVPTRTIAKIQKMDTDVWHITFPATGGGGGSMVYPGAGVAVSNGSAWTTSLTAPSGALVGTTDVQTLSGKSLDAPVLSSSPTTTTGSIGYNSAAGRFQMRDASLTRNVMLETAGGIYWAGTEHYVDVGTPTSGQNVGFRGMPLTGNVGSSRNLAANDMGRLIPVTSSSVTLTLVNNSTTALPVGFYTCVNSAGNFSTSVAADSGVTLYVTGSNSPAASTSVGIRTIVCFWKIGTNVWQMD